MRSKISALRAKKIYQLLAGIIFIILLNGCSSSPDVMMDELSEDNLFVYQNKDLEFEISFPETFEYYQVQRKNLDEYVEIEFFVPTSDKVHPQEVQGYARPVILRFYDNESWEQLEKKEYVQDVFEEVGQSKDGKFFLKFWKTRPKDWEEKWSQPIEEEIISSFKSL